MTEPTAYREFLFNYRFGGHEWGITIYADSPDEAKEKIRAVALARFEGEIYMRIPASMSLFGLLPRVITWLRRRQWNPSHERRSGSTITSEKCGSLSRKR